MTKTDPLKNSKFEVRSTHYGRIYAIYVQARCQNRAQGRTRAKRQGRNGEMGGNGDVAARTAVSPNEGSREWRAPRALLSPAASMAVVHEA